MKRTLVLFLSAITLITSVSLLLAANRQQDTLLTYESNFIKELRKTFSRFFEHTAEERVHVHTDKTFYNPGETVWFTAYVRDAKSLKPSATSDIVHVELISPRGNTARHYKLVANNGSATGDFDLNGMAGGIYTIRAYTNWQKNNPQELLFEKQITLQSNILPRLKMSLEFDKKAYGVNDEVTATLKITRNNNAPLSNTGISGNVQLSGNDYTNIQATTASNGSAQIRFKLPASLETADGIVNIRIPFEGSTESISRSIPIVLNKITLNFMPEGGDMVAGILNRVAFRAVNEFDKPADVSGTIVDSKGKFVAAFNSYHQGMGAVEFTPALGETYRARLSKPAGIVDEWELPAAMRVGYSLQTALKNENALQTRIYSFQNETLHLVTQMRGQIQYAKSFQANAGWNQILIPLEQMPMGVLQITLFDSRGIARNERLTFVNRQRQLKVQINTDKPQYKPREKVTATIQVTDDKGLGMPGNFSLAVVDDNLLSFADDKQGNLLSKILLEPELMQKIEEPAFYFNTNESKSLQALDYLMMTAGWRRYTWKHVMQQPLPPVVQQAEKARFSGIVYAGYTGKPLAGATIKVKGTSVQTQTDDAGKFTLQKFNIATHNVIEISADDYQTQTQTITHYQTNAVYHLYDGRYYLSEVQTVARGNAGFRKEERAMRAPAKAAPAPMADMAAVPDDAMWNAEALMEGDVAEDLMQPMDWEELPDVDKKEPIEQQIVNGKIADAREKKLEEAAKNTQQNNAIYYRAKEFPVRTYKSTDTTRNEFATTVYWNGNVETDRFGRGKVSFTANDLISSFRISLEGFADDGMPGMAAATYTTNRPLAIDMKVPANLVQADKAMLPLFIKNNTSEAINSQLFVQTTGPVTLPAYPTTISVPANDSRIVYLPLQATAAGEVSIRVRVNAGKESDTYEAKSNVIAKGFPATISVSAQDIEKEFTIHPKQLVGGSLKATFTAYPSVMNELMAGVDAILREPYGCFEQTSSSNYPNIIALQYLRSTKTNHPQVEARAKDLLDKGYKKLVAFETKENGYEWFGAAPAHEALTAYGLMEFEDMKQVYPHVDQKMIDRTAQLLMEKRNGEGGFKKNPRALDSFGAADEDITNAYIVYALTEAGYGKNIEKELTAVYRNALKTQDAYVMALAANALLNTGDSKRANELLEQLYSTQHESGYWSGKRHSITRSTGKSLQIETTALIVLAMLKTESVQVGALQKVVSFIVGSKGGYGMFGSTQSTILALKALTKYAEFSKKTDEAGTIQIWINNKLIASRDFAKGERNNVVVDSLEAFLSEGKQTVKVKFTGCKNALPYTMNIRYATTLPDNQSDCAVEVNSVIQTQQAKVGETVRLTTTLKNKTDKGQPMTMAIIGLPAGLSAQPWQLKELQEKGVIDFYEQIENNIACYYRALAPNATKEIKLDLKAEIPGEYDAPASNAYLYYTPELKHWAGGKKVVINP